MCCKYTVVASSCDAKVNFAKKLKDVFQSSLRIVKIYIFFFLNKLTS